MGVNPLGQHSYDQRYRGLLAAQPHVNQTMNLKKKSPPAFSHKQQTHLSCSHKLTLKGKHSELKLAHTSQRASCRHGKGPPFLDVRLQSSCPLQFLATELAKVFPNIRQVFIRVLQMEPRKMTFIIGLFNKKKRGSLGPWPLITFH